MGKVCGGYSERETPGLIPNPVVKPLSADGTAPMVRGGRVGRRRIFLEEGVLDFGQGPLSRCRALPMTWSAQHGDDFAGLS